MSTILQNWRTWFLFLLVIPFATLENTEDTCASTQDGTCSSNSNSNQTCQDNRPASNECPYWAKKGECEKNPTFMTVECRKSCGVCVDAGVAQTRESHAYRVTSKQTEKRLEETQTYLQSVKPDLKELCKNENELCTVWAVAGECEKNVEFMKMKCAAACFSCDYLTVDGRCPIDPNSPSAWEKDDLDNMFQRLTREPFLSNYDVQILSRDPWVITMENVVLPEEAERLIELGGMEGYERSHEVGKVQADGTYEKQKNSRRTSTNAWCQNECYEDAMAQKVVHRLSALTGIAEPNSEYLQLLRYVEGQAYGVHHDYIVHHQERQQGVRILTVYLYLNDVEAGGGTNFDQLNITVMPKRGRALLWPSVRNDNPNIKDGRTTHQALPTEKGIKYGANAWFHMHDFKAPNRIGCST